MQDSYIRNSKPFRPSWVDLRYLFVTRGTVVKIALAYPMVAGGEINIYMSPLRPCSFGGYGVHQDYINTTCDSVNNNATSLVFSSLLVGTREGREYVAKRSRCILLPLKLSPSFAQSPRARSQTELIDTTALCHCTCSQKTTIHKF